jgi:hypothetical protein
VYRAELDRISRDLKELNTKLIVVLSDAKMYQSQIMTIDELIAKRETKLKAERKEVMVKLDQLLVPTTHDKVQDTTGDARRVLGALAFAFAKNRPGGPWCEHERVMTTWRNGKREQVKVLFPPIR